MNDCWCASFWLGLVAGVACLAGCRGGSSRPTARRRSPTTRTCPAGQRALPRLPHAGRVRAVLADAYDEAQGYAALAAAATQSGEMPPWPPAAAAATLRNARTLPRRDRGVRGRGRVRARPRASRSARPPRRAGGQRSRPAERHPGPGVVSPGYDDDRRLSLLPRRCRAGAGAGFDRLQRASRHARERSPRARVCGAAGFAWRRRRRRTTPSRCRLDVLREQRHRAGADAPPTIGGWVPGVAAAPRFRRAPAFTWRPGPDRRAGALQPARRRRVRRSDHGRSLYYAAAPVAKRALVRPSERQLRDTAGARRRR